VRVVERHLKCSRTYQDPRTAMDNCTEIPAKSKCELGHSATDTLWYPINFLHDLAVVPGDGVQGAKGLRRLALKLFNLASHSL
jgi:hypothetical protein